jgi:hypothetical protein
MSRFNGEQFQLVPGAIQQLLNMSSDTQYEFPANIMNIFGTYIIPETTIPCRELYPAGKKCAIGAITAQLRNFPSNKLPESHTTHKRSNRTRNKPYNPAQTRQARVRVEDGAVSLSLFNSTGLISAVPISDQGTHDAGTDPRIILHARHIRPLQPAASEIRWSHIKTGTMMYVVGNDKELIGIVIVISIVSPTRISSILFAYNVQYPLPIEHESNGISFFHPDHLATLSDTFSTDPAFVPAPDGMYADPVETPISSDAPALPDLPYYTDNIRESVTSMCRIYDSAKINDIIARITAIVATFDYTRWAHITPHYTLSRRILCIIDKYKRGTLILDPVSDADLISLSAQLSYYNAPK